MPSLRRVIAGALLAFPLSAQANLILNGSFEEPPVFVGSFISVGAGDPIGAWTVVQPGNLVALISGAFAPAGISLAAQDGSQWVGMTGVEGSGGAGVQQIIATAVGQTYSLSFHVGNLVAQDFRGLTSSVEVFADGASLGIFTNMAGSATELHWQRYDTSFIASGAATAIAFYNRDDRLTDWFNGLDNVTIEAVGTTVVPLPAALPLLAAGLGVFGLLGFGRRQERSSWPGVVRSREGRGEGQVLPLA
jgi:hypothetical protein